MYSRGFTFDTTLPSPLTYSTLLTITTTDNTVEGSDAFTFTFTTLSAADFIVI